MSRDLEKQSIQVTIRIRPLSQKQLHQDNRCCIKADNGPQRLTLVNGNQSKSFAFDSVVGIEEGQQDIFWKVGLNSTTHCLEGYNCSIFAYGQTGSGKTFTMMGVNQEDPKAFEKRGLVPRTLEHLFQCIQKETEESRTQYLVKCTFLQIYNETIIDLLDKNNSNLQIREDLKKGVYVEGIFEQTISKAEQALELLRRGSKGRHVGSTYYNETSSRSHSVFTLLLQSKFTKNGVVNVKIRRFHFIDLAGSQRTRHSNGQRLKEGCSINKSLHVLGMVINSLVEATQGKPKHVNYRDSKLTFLLKDALGGNSKTHLIANISPGLTAYQQTLSTINFARRVKMIKLNKALINQDASGNLDALKSEILRLKQEIVAIRSHPSASLTVKQNIDNVSPVSSDLERVFLKSDGHLGLEKLLKDYIEESIQKETRFQVEILKKQEKIDKLYQAIKEYSKNQIHLRMIVEIYQKRFLRMKHLQAKLTTLNSTDPETLSEFVSQQKSALDGQVLQLRQLLKQTPFLKSLIKQNNILRQDNRNPQQLASLIGANMQFLSQLKQQLNSGIKERQQLNDIIQHYAMAKSTKDMMSPRKQKELEDQLESKEKEYEERIEQLGLEIAFLKSMSEQNEVLLKEAVEREMGLEDKIVGLEGKVEEGESYQQKMEELENQLKDTKGREQELNTRVQSLTRELISTKELINDKTEQLVEEKKSNTLLKQQLQESNQTTTALVKQLEQKIESLHKQLSISEQEQQSLSILLEQTQVILKIQKQKQQKVLEAKNEQMGNLELRIKVLQMQNLDYLTLIDAIKLQYQSQLNISYKNTQQLSLKLEKTTKQLESERVENKNRQEELQLRWSNEKQSNQDQAQKRITELNLKLIGEENKLSEIKIGYESIVEELRQKNMDSFGKIEELNKSIKQEKKQKDELKVKQSELVTRFNQSTDLIKQLQSSLLSKQHELNQSASISKTAIFSLQTKLKQLQSSLLTVQESQQSLKQDIERRQKQIERLKQSHNKQLEMIKSESFEYKERAIAHELSMKQIFDDCLKNKDKIISEIKQQLIGQSQEQKKLLQDSKEQNKTVQEKLIKVEERLREVEGLCQAKEVEIEKLIDQLNKQIDQSQSKAQERQIVHNEFIDRKNSEIEVLEGEIKNLKSQIFVKEENSKSRNEQLSKIFTVIGIESGKERECENVVEEIKAKFLASEQLTNNLEKQNKQLSTQLKQAASQESQLTQQVTIFSQEVKVLTLKIAEIKQKNRQQLAKSELDHSNYLTTSLDAHQKLNTLFEQQQLKSNNFQFIVKRLQTESIELSSELTNAKSIIQERNIEIENMKSKAIDLRADAESIHTILKEYKQTILDKDGKIQGLKNELKDMKSKLSSLQKQKQEVRENKQEMEKSNMVISEQLEKKDIECKEFLKYKEKYLQTESQLNQILIMNEKNKIQNIALQKSILEYEANITGLKQQLKSTRSQYDRKTEKVEMISQQLENINEQLVVANEQLVQANEKLILANEKLVLVSEENDKKMLLISSNQEQTTIQHQSNTNKLQQKIAEEKQINKQLHERINTLEQSNKQLIEREQSLAQNYLVQIEQLQKQKKIIEEQFANKKEIVLNKLKVMEEIELKSTEQRHQLERSKEDLENKLNSIFTISQSQKSKLEKEILSLSENQRLLESNNKSLQEANQKLSQNNENLYSNIKLLNEQSLKQDEKTIGLKRLIENLEYQKQQFEKELEQKEMSYKRLLSKICKQDEPQKVSEDKKTIMKTNELLEKSRLQLLEYKQNFLQFRKIAEENIKQIKKLKSEMQMKQEHYLSARQQNQEHSQSQEVKLQQIQIQYEKLEKENYVLAREMKELENFKEELEYLREELAGYRGYKEKSKKRREDLQLTIKSLSDELERVRKDDRVGGFKGQDQKMLFINKLKEENGLIKRQKFTLTEQMTRLKRQNQILLDKLSDESQEKLRLKQMYQRKTLKQSGHRDTVTPDVASKIELERKQAEIRYLQEGYAELCTILNIKKLSDPKNRGESTLGLIKNVVEGLTEEVSSLRTALKERQIEKERNVKMEYNQYKSKDYKRHTHDFNPIKNALEVTNKMEGDEYSSFQNLKNRALELKEQSKLRKDRY